MEIDRTPATDRRLLLSTFRDLRGRPYAAIAVAGLLLVCALARLPSTAEAAGTIVLNQPSTTESTLAPGRDLMVIGDLSGVEGNVANVRLELVDASGTVTRLVRTDEYTQNGAASLNLNGVVEGTSYTQPHTGSGTSLSDLESYPSPDLVDRDASTLARDPADLAVTLPDGTFAAIILGGATKDYTDKFDYSYADDLTAGTYTLRVTALDAGGNTLATTSQTLTVAASDMVFGRFSPTAADGYAHREKLNAFAQANGLKVMNDLLPGYWSMEDVFYEDYRLWRTNDLVEYLAAGETCGVIYNISPYCATQSVEIGGLTYHDYLQDQTPGHRVYLYRYDIGDTHVTYTRSNGVTVTQDGAIVPFDTDMGAVSSGYNQLAVARVERRSADVPTTENLYEPTQTTKSVAFDTGATVYAKSGQTLSFYGAVTPLAKRTDADVTHNPTDGSYSVSHRITDVHYTVTQPDGSTVSEVRTVDLTRQYLPSWAAESIYEFKHDFGSDVFGQEGVYTVTLQGLSGNSPADAVADADRTLTLTLSDTGLLSPSGGTLALSANQHAAGEAMLDLHLDSVLTAGNPYWLEYTAYSGTTDADRALDALTGVLRANAAGMALNPSAHVLNRLNESVDGRWSSALGATRSVNSDDNAPGYRLDAGGLIVGYDRRLHRKLRLGVALAGGRSNLRQDGGDSASAWNWQVGAYGEQAFGPGLYARGWGGLGFQYYDLDRTGLGGRTLTADTVGRSVTTALELGRPFTIGPTLTPVVGLDHRTVWMDGCREDGDPVVGLTYTDSTWHETRLRTGMRLLWNHGRATLQVSAFYARLLTGAPESTARFNAQDSRSFSVRGVDRARDAFEPGAALGLQLDDSANANLIVEARGEFSRGVSAGTVRLSLRYRF